jgi:hypothetical protein
MLMHALGELEAAFHALAFGQEFRVRTPSRRVLGGDVSFRRVEVGRFRLRKDGPSLGMAMGWLGIGWSKNSTHEKKYFS